MKASSSQQRAGSREKKDGQSVGRFEDKGSDGSGQYD